MQTLRGWLANVPAGEAEAFNLVAALDLTLMVPALAAGGLLLWRRHPFGFVVAAIAGVQGSLYLLVLALNAALFILRGQVEAPGELPIWGTLAAATSIATAALLSNAHGQLKGKEVLPVDRTRPVLVAR